MAKLRIALALIFSCALAPWVQAQSDRGTITGIVTDQAAAVVVKAAVTALNKDTGLELRAETTGTGDYTIPSVPAGSYTVTVEVPGFRRFVQNGVTVAVAQTAKVDATLQIGATTDSVTITSELPLLQAESSEQSTNITAQRINELPIQFTSSNGGAIRNPLAFAEIAPGSSVGGWNDIRINGSPGSTFRIIFEGQDSTNALFARVSDETQPSIDAVQEFTLQTSNFAAEYGQVSGGLFNFTARSGTNAFHGSAYDYFANDAFAAGDPFTHTRRKVRENDFGGSIGGPVRIPKVYDGRNKTFFFFNYEGYYQKQGGSRGLTTVPTNAYRTGDFSYLLTGRVIGTDPLGRSILEGSIYDPATSRVVNGLTVRDPFPGNIIPQGRMDPVALKIQSQIPVASAGYQGAAVSNFLTVYDSHKFQKIPSIKVDHNFTGNARVSGYLSWQNTNKTNGEDGLPDPISARRIQDIDSYTARINYDQIISPTMVNHMGIGYVRYHNPDSTASPNFDSIGTLGLTGALVTGFPRFDNLNINGQGLGFGTTNYQLYVEDKPTAVESLTWTRGSHTMKFGGEWRMENFSNINKNSAVGEYGFDASQTGLPSENGVDLKGGFIGNSYASFLLGLVNTAYLGNPAAPQYRRGAGAAFVQDTWKVSRRLTLDLGLRWDYQTVAHELWYRTTVTSLTIPNPSAGGLPGAAEFAGQGPGRCNCDFAKPYPLAFGPRIGAAYQIDDKTVLRAGWGLTYGQLPTFNYIGSGNSLGLGFNTQYLSNPAYGQPAMQLSNGFPADIAFLNSVNTNPGIRPDPGQLDAPPALIDHNAGRPPRISQWSIGLQRQLTKDLMVEANYVGNRGAWIQSNGLVDYNAISAQRLSGFGLNLNSAADLALLASPITSPQVIARGFSKPYAGFPDSATLGQSLRPFPQFSGIDRMWSPLGDNWYDSLQIKASKRYSHGLTATVAYTWSKTLTTVADEWGGSPPVNNVFNRQNQKTLSSYDQPQILAVSYTYEVPTAAWQRGSYTRRMLFQGWMLGGILRYSSGTPIQSPWANNGLYSAVFQGTLQNRVPGQPLYLKNLNCGCVDPNQDFVLNPKAWADPAPGQWGTAAAYYSDYRYARHPSEQMSIAKTFKLRESMALDLRFEVFNPFNRLELGNPDGGNPQSSQVRDANGTPTGGFGRLAPSLSMDPRAAQLVARFSF